MNVCVGDSTTWFLMQTQNRKAFKSMLKTGTTLSIGELVADGEWEVLTIFAG